MKQLFQNLKTGETTLEELPMPGIPSGHVQIQTVNSLISLGTERMLVSFSQAGLIDKARQQPEKVKMVLDKIRTDGLFPTIESVFSRLDEPLPLGYCNAGVVIGVGKDIDDIKIGDRVTSNGPHAEVVTIPRNLVAKIPEGVDFESAAFAVIGSIGLQGLRLADPTLGELVVVVGLGLVGQLTAQLAKANGCRVIGLDVDNKKIEIAKSSGIDAVNSLSEDVIEYVKTKSDGYGADAVIITASSKSNEIIKQAAGMCRKRGRVVLVGVVGLDIDRSDFYEKEISFQVSCSYGPGRYENNYEQNGIEYPLPFVRWTENRNFKTILECVRNNSLNVKKLISERVDFESTPKLYADLSTTENIATLIQYAGCFSDKTVVKTTTENSRPIVCSKGGLGIIGAGLFTKATLLPILKKESISVNCIVSQSGASSTHLAKKFSIPKSSTQYKDVLSDPDINSVIITTRHNMHGEMVVDGLKAGKQVFVEKPLTIDKDDLVKIESALTDTNSIMVGFNRRFSPLSIKMKSYIGKTSLINASLVVNAGMIPQNHWTQNPEVGGGRILGDACHFIDLFLFLAESPLSSVCASSLGKDTDIYSDNVVIILKCKNGSQATLNYFANGNKAWPKETVEIYTDGKVMKIDNFRTLFASGVSGFKKMKLKRQDKGHAEQFRQYHSYLCGQQAIPIPFADIVNTTKASFAILESLRSGEWVTVD